MKMFLERLRTMGIYWDAPVSKTVHILDAGGHGTKLFWYGVTFGMYGFGVLVMRKADE